MARYVPPPLRTRLDRLSAWKAFGSRRVTIALYAAGVLALTTLLLILFVLIQPLQRHGATPRRQQAVLHAPTPNPAKAQAGLSANGAVYAAIVQRLTAWMDSMDCACDRNLAAVETGALLETDRLRVQDLHVLGQHVTVSSNGWTANRVDIVSSSTAEAVVTGSDSRAVYQGKQHLGTAGGPYTTLYRLERSGGVWKVAAIVPINTDTVPAPVPTSTPAATNDATVLAAAKTYLQVWAAALKTNDASQLPTVTTEPLLTQSEQILQQDKAQHIFEVMTELDAPVPGLVTFKDATHAQVTFTRHYGAMDYDLTTKAQQPSSEPDIRASWTYSLTLVNGRWLVSSRTRS